MMIEMRQTPVNHNKM